MRFLQSSGTLLPFTLKSRFKNQFKMNLFNLICVLFFVSIYFFNAYSFIRSVFFLLVVNLKEKIQEELTPKTKKTIKKKKRECQRNGS